MTSLDKLVPLSTKNLQDSSSFLLSRDFAERISTMVLLLNEMVTFLCMQSESELLATIPFESHFLTWKYSMDTWGCPS